MRILVTGGLGFIGWEVAQQAVAAGHQVVLVDDCSANVVDPRDANRLTPGGVIRARVQAGQLAEVVAPDLDAVIHCASPVGAAGVIGRDCVTEITEATSAAIRIAQAAGCPLINVSTSEVYGQEGTNAEGDPLVIPPRYSSRLGYAVGKLAGEHQVAHAAHHGLRAVSVRPFNVVGPLQAPGKGFVLPRFCEQAWAGEMPTVFGSGRQARALLHVADAARFLLLLLDRPQVLDGRAINVGAEDNTVTVERLALAVQSAVHRAGGPAPRPLALVDGRDVFGDGWEEAAAGTKLPDPTLAHRIGWRPRMDLWGIVSESVEHHRPAAREAA